MTKVCKDCNENKSTSEFYFKNKATGRLYTDCKICRKQNAKQWRNVEKSKDNRIKHLYEISLQEYNEMFTRQNGCCFICEKHQINFKRSLAIDHNHQTGRIRRLLCGNCNVLLGHAKDNPEILARAINYLTKDLKQ